ncbi:MAG: ABC transporter ATP-binding protein [Chloroflexi bacterium]|nr:ABC transporter ATP-binding protein [Chloroflexota bacterium]
MSQDHIMLEARDLSVVLGGHEVIAIPSLTVMSNEVLGIIGPNGSGKTTLLLSLALLLRPAGGSILYQGQPVANGVAALRLRRRFAVVFQETLLLSGSVWDNVTLGLHLRGVGKEETVARARKWLARFGIAALAKRQARTLSGGEAKRVSLARAFVLQPEVLFLDEPFTALDSPTRQALLDDFESVLRETRVTTVMVTHDRNEAIVLADRVAVLMDGRIRQVGTPEEVFSYPVDEEVARFVEAGNVLRGVVSAQSGGLATVAVGDHHFDAVSDLAVGTRVTLFLRHEDVTLTLPPTQSALTSARNRLVGKVVKVFPLGSQVRLTVDCGFPLVALVTRRSAEEMELILGKTVHATFKATAVHVLRE